MVFRRRNRQNEIEIQLEDAELIMDDKYPSLDAFLNTVFCSECADQTGIENYKVFLDDTNDIIFEGRCIKCKGSVSRYIETGESRASAEIARHIRSVKKLSKGG